MSDSGSSGSDSETEETRKMVAQQNKKKKKSGGFQSMGKYNGIRKTCPCNLYPFEPHFYIVKLGYVGV